MVEFKIPVAVFNAINHCAAVKCGKRVCARQPSNVQSFLLNRQLIHEQLGKLSGGRIFTYAQGFRVNAACTAASPANNYT